MSEKQQPPKYRVLAGMNYLDKRREPGDVVDDIPERSLPWLLRDGHIEPAGKPVAVPHTREEG